MDTPFNIATGLLETASFPTWSVMARFRTWRAERRQIARITSELGSYSNSELADLGLKRGDIADVAHGRFRQG